MVHRYRVLTSVDMNARELQNQMTGCNEGGACPRGVESVCVVGQSILNYRAVREERRESCGDTDQH